MTDITATTVTLPEIPEGESGVVYSKLNSLTVSMEPLVRSPLSTVLIRELQDRYTRAAATPNRRHLDLRYCGDKTLSLKPGTSKRVRTGVAIKEAPLTHIGVITTHPELEGGGLRLHLPFRFHEIEDDSEITLVLENGYLTSTLIIRPGDLLAQYTLMECSELSVTLTGGSVRD